MHNRSSRCVFSHKIVRFLHAHCRGNLLRNLPQKEIDETPTYHYNAFSLLPYVLTRGYRDCIHLGGTMLEQAKTLALQFSAVKLSFRAAFSSFRWMVMYLRIATRWNFHWHGGKADVSCKAHKWTKLPIFSNFLLVYIFWSSDDSRRWEILRRWGASKFESLWNYVGSTKQNVLLSTNSFPIFSLSPFLFYLSFLTCTTVRGRGSFDFNFLLFSWIFSNLCGLLAFEI